MQAHPFRPGRRRGVPLQPWLGAAGAVLLVLALFLPRLEVTFFAVYAYEIAWWSLIALLDGIVWWRRGRSPLTASPRAVLLLALWSVAFWFAFELVNLRLENWYYVNVSPEMAMRWLTGFLAFSTVLPGVFLAAECLRAFLPAESAPVRVRRVPRWLPAVVLPVGAACLALPLLRPGQAYPLVWLGVFLLLEPVAYQPGGRSLTAEWECGRARSLGLYLAAGLLCGLLWELFNDAARVKWIYTVPFFERLKLFEMPLAGFLGFPPFAVECWIFMLALERLGLGTDWSALGRGDARSEPRLALKLGAAALVAAGTAALALPGMARRTIGSVYPTAESVASHLEALGAGAVATAHPGLDAFEVRARLEDAPPAPERDRALEFLELATLAGIGLEKAAALERAGIRSVADLARADDEQVYRALDGTVPGLRLTRMEIRVWIRAARDGREPGAGPGPAGGPGEGSSATTPR